MSPHTKTLFVIGIIALSSIGVRSAGTDHHARLSADLLGYQARRIPTRTRVIVHGDAATIDALAQRHSVPALEVRRTVYPARDNA